MIAAASLVESESGCMKADGENDVRMLTLAAEEVARMAPTVKRYLAIGEIFAGHAGVSRAVVKDGFHALLFERDPTLGHPSMDTTLLGGLLYAGFIVLSILPSGTAFITPQCSTWLDMCRYHTKRDRGQNIFGDCDRLDVREANFNAMVTCPFHAIDSRCVFFRRAGVVLQAFCA